MFKNVYWSSCKVPLFWPSFNEIEFCREIFENFQIKFCENPSSLNRVVPCGRTDGQTDKTVLIVTFRNLAKAPKIYFGFEVYAKKNIFLILVGITLLFNFY
jgi:hypothetical protein